ncbi:YihY/virulence factor BrkB family protein [Actinophytocola sp.]|uniref:YihY/virulence factor BrkB family protein n=1 Tax=Actinophytocola sp. TaxID=1872138 RepID=UPI003899C0CA
MSPQPQHPTRNAQQATSPLPRRGPLRLFRRTWVKAWSGNLFSEAAEAAFWQVLSLPPLLLGLLGSLGYVAQWFGQDVINSVHTSIIEWSHTAFSNNVVDDIIQPTVDDILRHGRGEIVTVGFLISLWGGSSAMSSFVDAITVAHDQYGVRNEVWQRIFALLLYMAALILLVIGLPILALGPDVLPKLFPVAWRHEIAYWVDTFYYPALGVMLVLALATLYKLALPRKLPYYRGLPGAVLAMIVFLLSSIGLRLYISWITTTGYTYGALATPIAFLLFAFFIGLAIVLGAYFNAAIQEMYPARMTKRQRRRWRRLEMTRAAGGAKKDTATDPQAAPEQAPPDQGPADQRAVDQGPNTNGQVEQAEAPREARHASDS